MGKHLVVGLGNPGRAYAQHRHNVGFMVLDEVARRGGAAFSQTRFGGRFATADIAGRPAALLQPETWMNNSGRAVARAAGFYDTAAEDVVVVHDDLDLPYGRVRVKLGGGHGGHNGLRSIVADLGSPDFLRVRVGIGRPPRGDATAHVLSPFDADERAALPLVVDRASDAVEALVQVGFTAAANEFNGSASQQQSEWGGQ